MIASNWQRTGSLNLLSLGTSTQCPESNWSCKTFDRLAIRAAGLQTLPVCESQCRTVLHRARWPWPRNWCYVSRLRLRTSDQSNVAARPAKIASRWLHLPSSPPNPSALFSLQVEVACSLVGRCVRQLRKAVLESSWQWWISAGRAVVAGKVAAARRGEAMAGRTEQACYCSSGCD